MNKFTVWIIVYQTIYKFSMSTYVYDEILKVIKSKYEKVIVDTVLTYNIVGAVNDKLKIVTNNGDTKYVSFMAIGKYVFSTGRFEWSQYFDMFRDQFIGDTGNVKAKFGAYLAKLFKPSVKLPPQTHCIIPFLVAMYNPQYNITRAETLNRTEQLYILLDTKLDNPDLKTLNSEIMKIELISHKSSRKSRKSTKNKKHKKNTKKRTTKKKNSRKSK